MPRRYLFKSPAFLTGSGVVGTGAVSIGGWQFTEDFYPYGGEQLVKQGFSESIPKPDLDASVATGVHQSGQNPFKFQPYGCFQNFFPGATVNHSVVDNSQKEDSFTLPVQTDIVSDHNPIGCSLMNFSYEVNVDKKQDSKKIKYVFKSEVTVKNDKFGWALWAGSKKLPTPGQDEVSALNERADYYLIFLKKASDTWNILGGYSWSDSTISGGNLMGNVNILSPDADREKGNWYSPISNADEGTSKGSNEYSGIWEVTKGTGNEIFQDIELWLGKKEDKYDSDEILGRGFKKGTSYIDFTAESSNDAGYGYEDTKYLYSSDTGWTRMSTSKDITKTLNDMYFPFRGKKGKWKKTEEYCSSKKSSRIYWKDIYKLQNFCYKK